MLQILEFALSSGWRFAGTVAIILALAVPIRCLRPIVIRIERE